MAEPPLSEEEIQNWLERLATTDRGRITVMNELLKNRVKDSMSDYDFGVITRCLVRVRMRLEQSKAQG